MEEDINEVVLFLLNKKADENNRIDLNAYGNGLIDMFNFITKRDEHHLECKYKYRECKHWHNNPNGCNGCINIFKLKQ